MDPYEITVHAYDLQEYQLYDLVTANVEPNMNGSFFIPIDKNKVVDNAYYSEVTIKQGDAEIVDNYHAVMVEYSDRVGIEAIALNEDKNVMELTLNGNYAFYNADPQISIYSVTGKELASTNYRYRYQDNEALEVLPKKVELSSYDNMPIDESEIAFIQFSNKHSELDVVELPYHQVLNSPLKNITVKEVKFIEDKKSYNRFRISLEGLKKYPDNVMYPYVELVTEDGSRLGASALYGLIENIEIPYYQEQYKGKKAAFLLINGMAYPCTID